MLLAGDIGGTKTELALFPAAGGTEATARTVYKSANYNSLEAIIREFLAEQQPTVTSAVFGVAGPVIEGESKITNLPWVISEQTLLDTFDFTGVKLLNDLEAIAYAVPHLGPDDLVQLNTSEVQPDPDGHKGIVAPGTGLGEAIAFRHGSSYSISASEGGHTDFGPTNPLQLEFLRYMLGKFRTVSYERVCSGGMGIPNIYDFLYQIRQAEESPTTRALLEKVEDPTPVIIKQAMNNECNLCWATLDMFITILGAEAGNLALTILARGGIYLAGGIPPRILPRLQDGKFMAAFLNKGRLSEMLGQVPVYVIINKDTPILGSTYYARSMENG